MKTLINLHWIGCLKLYLFLGIMLCCGIQCQQQNSRTYFTGEEGEYGYNLSAPSRIYKLPKILKEISGLSYYKPGVLACIQDEDGKLFLYDLEQEEILYDKKFAGDDDYEGIAINDQQVFVVNSSGDIFSFMINDDKAEKFNTDLNSRYDVEGLVYRAGENDLILACKENPDNEDEAIFFSFDLSQNKLSEEPAITVKFDEVKQMLKESNFSTVKHLPFKPSGIAVHPQNHQIYVIASVGKLLLILSEAGDLLKVVPLPPDLFDQPEGICFDNNGNLYIASEGKKSAAGLFVFERTSL